jgi:hypothetical protein
MGKIHMDFEDVKDCFDDGAFSQEDFFHKKHKIIFHISPYSYNEFEPALIKFFKQVLREKPLVCQKHSLTMTVDTFIMAHTGKEVASAM